jgi:hypothetical protein
MVASPDHVPHPAPGILHITWPTRDQMDVAVEDRLPSSFAGVDAHIEARNRRIEGP